MEAHKIGEKQETALLSFKDCLKKNEEMNAGKQKFADKVTDKINWDQSSVINGSAACSAKTPTKSCSQEASELVHTSGEREKAVSSGTCDISETCDGGSISPGKLDPGHSADRCERSAVTSNSALTAGVNSPMRQPQTGEFTPNKAEPTAASAALSPSKIIVSPTHVSTAKTTGAASEGTTVSLPSALVSPGMSAGGSQGMVYVRCVDNQGKIYLIPQQLLPQLTGLNNQQSPNKKNNLSGRSVHLGSLSPGKSSVPVGGISASQVSMEALSAAKTNLQSFPNSTSLLRPTKMNSVKQTATVSVTKAAGESGLLTLNTVTSPVKPSPQVPMNNPKDIKVSTIASCPKAKQPLIFLTQNSQKTISLLQGNSASVGKTTAVIGGIGGMSLVQPSLSSQGATKPVSVGGVPVSSAGSAAKPQASATNFVLSRNPAGVTNLIIGGNPRPQTQSLLGATPRAQGLMGPVSVSKAQPSATQLVITGSSPRMPAQRSGSASSANLGSRLMKNEGCSTTSQPVQPSTSSLINSGQILKTGTTILLNKGLPMSRLSKPAAPTTNMTNMGAASSQLSTSQIKTSPAKTHQTMVATIGNQHYLLQLIPDQQTNKQPQSATLSNPVEGNSQAAKPVIGQTLVNMSNHLSKTSVNHALGNFNLSAPLLRTAASPAMTSTATTSAGTMNSVFINPNYLTRTGNFKPVQLMSRYCRKRDKGDGDVSLLSQQRPGEAKNRIILGKKTKPEVKSEQTANIR